jgi:hypothetical protein
VNSSQERVSKELYESYDEFKSAEIISRRFTQKMMLRWIEPILRKKTVRAFPLGQSSEGRTISMYECGRGPVKVLLWSQMHGDEPTATMALMDILGYLSLHQGSATSATILQNLQLLVIPMLNPDGAERFTRRTAQLIDMNRDASALVTPEARILKDAQQKYKPAFGFNLHDQDPRQTVGLTKNVTAIALLAPATDDSRGDDPVRLRAKNVADGLARVLHQFIPGHIAKYDDTFEKRAFGDNIQRWGTSTVLVESGGWPGDRDKMFIRKLNAVGLLTALHSIATGESAKNDRSLYDALPFNGKNLYDVIVREVDFKINDKTPSVRVDIAFNIEEKVNESKEVELIARVVDLGDLSTYSAFDDRNGKRISLNASQVQLDLAIPWKNVELLLK